MLSSILIFKQLQTSSQIQCTKVLETDGQQYTYCYKQQSLNQHNIIGKLSSQHNNTNIFINTKYIKQTFVQVCLFSLNQFAVFGFADNSHTINGGLINVSLNVNVSQAALVCMQCQLSVSNSQLVFIASGQLLSAVALQVLLEIEMANTSVQYRFQSLQAAGLISQIGESIFVSLVDVKLNGYNSEQSQYSGFLVSKVSVSILINLANLQLCANEAKAVGAGAAYLLLNGEVLASCPNSCSLGSFYSYGICVSQLLHGEMANGTFVCVDPFEFDGEIAECVCKEGYMINTSYCIPVVISITNLDTAMHELNSQTNLAIGQQKYYLESAITGNASLMDQHIGSNVSSLNATISQIAEELDANLNRNFSALQLEMQASATEIQIMLASNRSMVENQMVSNISQLQYKLNQNITDLSQKLQLEIQDVNQSATQIAGHLADLQMNVNQIVLDQTSNNSNQQNQIVALDIGIQQLQSSQQLLRSDLLYANQSLSTRIQDLQTETAQIDVKVLGLASLTASQYSQQQAQLANLDQYLAHNISVLNSTIQGQLSALGQADSALLSSLSALQTQFSALSSTSALNNTNQQNQINSLQSAVSTQQAQVSQVQSDIQSVNSTLTSKISTLQISIVPFINQIVNIDSQQTMNYNNQQVAVQTLTNLYTNITQYYTQLLTNFNNMVSTTNTQLQTEINARINGDSALQTQLNSILTSVLSNKNQYLSTNSSLNAFVNNQFVLANQTYATKEEMNRYLCLKKPSHSYVVGLCLLVCGSGAVAQGEVCVCSNSSLVYTNGACQLACGSGATAQSGICVCTNPNYSYTGGTCVLLTCGSGATIQSGVCKCSNSSLSYVDGKCQVFYYSLGVCECQYPFILNIVELQCKFDHGEQSISDYCQCNVKVQYETRANSNQDTICNCPDFNMVYQNNYCKYNY
ncbi:Conserved_hypothetical protein [Hexamita inflata]|uniref:Uncharacterized protein n=1 Tax=Hexamita inflata TaxID=28002 RepID=A0AA86NAH8_9EUKA|nr:Conserved hypothetical protein [Hexamita inflata]